MRGSSASPATTAVRWNSHEHLTKRRAAPAVRAAAGVAAPRTLAYAVRINSLSRGLVKAALCVALFSIFGKRFLQGQGLGTTDGASDGATGTGGYEGHNGWDERVGMGSGSALRSALGSAMGSAMVVLEVVVARGDLLQSVAGWVCLVMAGPLVVSAMVLNNSERLSSLSSLSSSGRALGVSQGWRDRNGLGGAGKDGLLDARGGAQEHSTLTITPPARSTRGGLRVEIGGEGDGAGAALFTKGGREGFLDGEYSTERDTPRLTPGSTRSGRSARAGVVTPRSRRAVTRSLTPNGQNTPIESILQDFDAAADAAVTGARAPFVGAQGFAQGMGMSMGDHGTTFMSMAAAQQAGVPGDGFPDLMQQPLYNTYRPSAVQKGYVSTPRPDGTVVSSLPTDRDRVLAELGIDEDILERAVEALREWIACRMLQPLVKIISVAHTNVINSAKSIGIEVPRDSLIDLSESGVEASSRLSDQTLSLGNFYAQVTQHMAMPAISSNPAEHKRYERCLRAIVTYNCLLRLLRAEFVPGLLPASPDGYILKRIKELANGTAMYDFVFDSGGESNGKPWNPEYPTDTAVVLYLFACFLAAPFWSFADKMDYCKVEGPADVLFLGKLPPRVGGEFTAILPSRLPKGCIGTALQGLTLGGQTPHIAITVEGVPKLTETGQLGLFRSIVLWLLYVADGKGVLGNVTLSSLHLDGVLSKRRGFVFIEQLRKLHLW
jgi:hypothetical protein